MLCSRGLTAARSWQRGACWPAGLAAGYRNPRSTAARFLRSHSLVGAKSAPRSSSLCEAALQLMRQSLARRPTYPRRKQVLPAKFTLFACSIVVVACTVCAKGTLSRVRSIANSVKLPNSSVAARKKVVEHASQAEKRPARVQCSSARQLSKRAFGGLASAKLARCWRYDVESHHGPCKDCNHG